MKQLIMIATLLFTNLAFANTDLNCEGIYITKMPPINGKPVQDRIEKTNIYLQLRPTAIFVYTGQATYREYGFYRYEDDIGDLTAPVFSYRTAYLDQFKYSWAQYVRTQGSNETSTFTLDRNTGRLVMHRDAKNRDYTRWFSEDNFDGTCQVAKPRF